MNERSTRPAGIIDHLIRLPSDNIRARVRRGLWISAGANVVILIFSFFASNPDRYTRQAAAAPPLNLVFAERKAPEPTPKPEATPAPIPTPAPTPRPQPVPEVARKPKPTPPPKVAAQPAPTPQPILRRTEPIPVTAPVAVVAFAPKPTPIRTTSALAAAPAPAAPAAERRSATVATSSNAVTTAPAAAAAPVRATQAAPGTAGVRAGARAKVATSPTPGGVVSTPSLAGARRVPGLGATVLVADANLPAPGSIPGERRGGLGPASGQGLRGALGSPGLPGGRGGSGGRPGPVGVAGGTARIGRGGPNVGGLGNGLGVRGTANGRGPTVGVVGRIGGGRGPARGAMALADLGGGPGGPGTGGDGDGTGVASTAAGRPDGVRGAPVFASPGAVSGGLRRGAPGVNAPLSIVYVLDSSGSMRERNKIGKAKEAIRQALNSLGPRDKFNIVHFDNGVYLFSSGLRTASQQNVSDALEFVDNIQCRPNTNLSSAMEAALPMQGVSTIFLMSDGEPHGGVDDPDDLKALIRQLNRNRAIIHTLALTLGERFRGVELLKEIAEENGGQFAMVNLSR